MGILSAISGHIRTWLLLSRIQRLALRLLYSGSARALFVLHKTVFPWASAESLIFNLDKLTKFESHLRELRIKVWAAIRKLERIILKFIPGLMVGFAVVLFIWLLVALITSVL